MTTTVTRTFQFAMGHRLQHHDGLCRFPHGHTYGAEITVARVSVAAQVPDPYGLMRDGPGTGMVVDFTRLDAMVQDVVGTLDHAFMVEESDPFRAVLLGFQDAARVHTVPFSPTAENIARYLAAWVKQKIERDHLRVVRVTVHEGPKSSATVEPR